MKSFIKDLVAKQGKKVKGKHSPISEIVDKTPKILKVDKIYSLDAVLKNLYIFIAQNYVKQPKKRHFLAISVASHSSDLLANLAKKSLNKDFKLIQYCIYPKTARVNLLVLKEINSPDKFEDSISILKELRKTFRSNIMKLIDQ